MDVVQGVTMVRHSQPRPSASTNQLDSSLLPLSEGAYESTGNPAIQRTANRVCPTRTSFLFHEALIELGMV